MGIIAWQPTKELMCYNIDMSRKRKRHGRKRKTIQRNLGITDSEKYLNRLCDKIFLSLWSYPGLYRDQGNKGTGKEICDLLVVFGNHILIFSDKDIKYPNSGDASKDWNRWFKRAVMKSADQIWGAERWLKDFPDRVFLDKECTQKFPIPLPPVDHMKIHRIVVAHGMSKKFIRELGGSGSLIIAPDIIGNMHLIDKNRKELPNSPYSIGQINPEKGFVHVLDDTSLDILLNTLDTISDFVAYLEKKEKFILFGKLRLAAGEEELLAYYLQDVNDDEEHDFVFDEDMNEDGATIALGEGFWDEFKAHPQRIAQIKANKISVLWDQIIENFNAHIMAGTLQYTTDTENRELESEKLMRLMARETRTRRRLLASKFAEILQATPIIHRRIRVVNPSYEGDPFYVFLFLRRPPRIPFQTYRKTRIALLDNCCMVTKLIYPDAKDIIGIATEPGLNNGGRSKDALYLDARDWTDEKQEEAINLQQDLNILVNTMSQRGVVPEYPEV